MSLRGVILSVKFFFIIALAAFFPPQDVGLYGLISVTVSYSIYFVGFEFYTYSSRDIVAKPRYQWPGLLCTQMFFFVIVYILVLPVLSFFFWFDMLPWRFISEFLALVVVEHLSTELMRLLIAIEKPLLATAVIFTKQALWVICFAFAMWIYPNFRNLDMLLLFWIIGATASVVIGFWPLVKLGWRGVLNSFDWVWVKKGVAVALPLMLSSVAVKSLFTFDRYAFEALNGLALAGAYSVYIGIASAMLSFLDSGVFVFYYPKMMASYKKKDLIEFEVAYQNLLKRSLLWLIFLVCGASAAGVLVFPKLGEPVYGHNLPLFLAIVIAVSIYIIGCIFQYGLYSTGRDISIVLANVIGLVVSCAVVFPIAIISDYWAVTVAMIVGSSIASFIKFWKWLKVRKELHLA